MNTCRMYSRRGPGGIYMSSRSSVSLWSRLVWLAAVIGLICCTALFVQAQEREGRQGGGRGGGRGGERGGGGGGRAQETIAVATDKVTPEIPGVVKAGTKIEIIATGLRGSDAGIGTNDGGFIFTGNGG